MSTVTLAGFNVDADTLTALERGEPSPGPLTPETLSAAYARISRDPRPVGELRADARFAVERARASNERIVFGMGHASVAEHAVFNFDLVGLSRLAVEAVQSHRLASYTEKSQRYIRLGEDFVVPAEVAGTDREAPFRAFVLRCFERYASACRRLEAAGVAAKLAGEDARYLLPLATSAQFGMTVNARTLEHLVSSLAANPLAEAREVGARLHELGYAVAPSLLRYCEPRPADSHRAADVADAVRRIVEATGAPADVKYALVNVLLVQSTPEGDETILAALARGALGLDFPNALRWVRGLDDAQRDVLFRAATNRMTLHDAAPREFEHFVATFQVTLSAAAWGQLKRHRIASPTPGPYDPALECTTPPSFEAAGCLDLLREGFADAGRMIDALGGPASPVAQYAVLNAHRRRVLLTVNAREACHISRLREDAHAQWDIRAVAAEMSDLFRALLPVCGAVFGGKDRQVVESASRA